MRSRILGAVVVILASCAGTAAAGTIDSAVFSGTIHVQVRGAHDYNDDWPNPGWGWRWEVEEDNVYLSQAGKITADVSDSTQYPCQTIPGGWDCSGATTYWEQAYSNVILTGGATPTVGLLGFAENGIAQGVGSILYYYRLDKLAADAPDVAVPVYLSGSGSLFTADSNPDLTTNVWVEALVDYAGPSHNYTEFVHDDVGTYFPNQGDTIHYEGMDYLQPGQMASIRMSLYGTAGSSGVGAGGEFQAVLDPQIQIASWFMVSYNGQQVPATDLYSLTYSPELGSSVPEPASLMLVGIGLIVFARFVGLRHPGAYRRGL